MDQAPVFGMAIHETKVRFVIWWVVASAVGAAIGCFGLGESTVTYATGEYEPRTLT